MGKGANNVCSLKYDFISHRYKNAKISFHADNCKGQNKNCTNYWFDCWLITLGILLQLTQSFMIAGHTKNYNDRVFGCVKREYFRSDIFNIPDFVDCTKKCAEGSIPVVTEPESGVRFFHWHGFLFQFFKPIAQISKVHQWRPEVVVNEEGVERVVLKVKNDVDDVNFSDRVVMKTDITLDHIRHPERHGRLPLEAFELKREPISLKRANYLQKTIRPLVNFRNAKKSENFMPRNIEPSFDRNQPVASVFDEEVLEAAAKADAAAKGADDADNVVEIDA